MADIYLIKYSVKGIKAIDQLVSLSFYKKIIPKNAVAKKSDELMTHAYSKL